MEKKGESSDGIVDPLANYWGLSLFPSSFSVPPSKPYDDLDNINDHLRSMALRSPRKLVEQTKAILDENMGLFNEEKNDVVAEEGEKEFARKRRPGLGLKRARSFKPTKMPSVEDLLPPLDVDNLKDPVEFFLAHERFDNAKKEIQKLMGIASVESNGDDISTKPRKRRPGLFGDNRRPVKLRHRYSTETLDNNVDVPSSQEAFGSVSRNPVDEDTEKGEACLTPLENEVPDSSAVEENKLNDILQGLLSQDPEDLEGVGAMNLLQERLQIKPVVVEKLCVPDFPLPDNQAVDLKSLRGNVSKPRKALADIDNILKRMSNKTPVRKDVGCATQQLASPTPPRSPFALLSSLQQHISRSKASVDPFSDHEIVHLSTSNYSPMHKINQKVNLVDSGKPSNELNAHITEDVIAASETNTNPDTSNNSKEESFGKSSEKLKAPLIEDTVAVNETSLVEDPVRNCTSTPQKSMVDNSRECGFDANDDSHEPHLEDVIAASETNTIPDTSENSKEESSGKSSEKLNAPLIEDTVAVNETSLVDDPVRNCTSTPQKSMVDNSRECEFDANDDLHEPHVDMDVDIGGSGMGKGDMDDTVGSQNVEPHKVCQFEDKMLPEHMQAFTTSMPTEDVDCNLVNPLDQSSPVEFQANAKDKCTSSDDVPEQCLQEKIDGNMAPGDGQKGRKIRSRKESKDKRQLLQTQRHSLAAAGTSCKSGLRRSTRMRTRPLEYWKGERPVYGRVHESLTTVIGVKCFSPGSDGKPTMKVKSFVSDKYKELFEISSLH